MESTIKPTTENQSGEKSPLDRLREFAAATADINPHLMGDVERGWIKPHGGLMEFVDRMTHKPTENHNSASSLDFAEL